MAMKNRPLLTVIASSLVILLLLAFIFPRQMIAPGRLIEGHKALQDDCFACHTPLLGSTAAKCIDCHAVADIGIRTTRGQPVTGKKDNVAFHQKLLEEDCTACHSDHRGVMAFRPVRLFSHELLQDAVREQCDACHRNPGDTLHRKIEGNCAQCHTIAAWQPATFEHDKYFRLDRDHDTKCVTCHTDSNYSEYTCYGCHEHTRRGVRKEHIEEGIHDFENCTECHRSADEDEAERIWRRKRRERD
jgi:hypothetical protein